MTGLPLKTAGGISLVALGALAGYAVGSGPAGEQPSAATAKRPVEVRTQTIRRTVRIVKRERPKHERPDPARTVASAAPAPAQQATAVAPQSAPSISPTSPTNSAPVRTRTSGAGPAGGEREHAEEHDRGEREGRDD